MNWTKATWAAHTHSLTPRTREGARLDACMHACIHRAQRTYLIGVDVDNLVDVEREQDVEEEDLVAPDDPLLLALPPQPLRPLVRHELHPEPFTRTKHKRRTDIFHVGFHVSEPVLSASSYFFAVSVFLSQPCTLSLSLSLSPDPRLSRICPASALGPSLRFAGVGLSLTRTPGPRLAHSP